MSIDNLEALDAEPLLIKVLALQNVCRHFREITRDIPQFWTFLSSTMPLAFNTQIKLSKNHDLHLKLSTPDIRYKRVRNLLQNYPHRWRSLHVIIMRPCKLIKLFTEHISTSTFSNVTDLRVEYDDYYHYVRQEAKELHDALVTRMPNLLRLETFDQIPKLPDSRMATTGITSLSVSITGRHNSFSYCIAEEIVKFIMSYPLIEKLRLHPLFRHGDYASDYSYWLLDDPSCKDIRKLDVTFVIGGILSFSRAWDDLWTNLNHMGVYRLNIEIVGSRSELFREALLCEALDRLASFKTGPAITELSISSSTELTPSCSEKCKPVRRGSYDISLGHLLSPSLRLIKMVDCSPAVVKFMLPLIEYLLARQAKLGTGTLEKVVIRGGATSVDSTLR